MFVFLIRDKGKHSWTVLSFLVNLARSCQLYQPLFILGWSFYLPQTRCQRSIVYLFSPCILCLILLLVFLVLTFWIFILYLNIDVLPSKIFIYCVPKIIQIPLELLWISTVWNTPVMLLKAQCEAILCAQNVFWLSININCYPNHLWFGFACVYLLPSGCSYPYVSLEHFPFKRYGIIQQTNKTTTTTKTQTKWQPIPPPIWSQ